MAASDLSTTTRRALRKWADAAGVSQEVMAIECIEAYVRLAASVPAALPGKSPGTTARPRHGRH
jgi:hypothetical protein